MMFCRRNPETIRPLTYSLRRDDQCIAAIATHPLRRTNNLARNFFNGPYVLRGETTHSEGPLTSLSKKASVAMIL